MIKVFTEVKGFKEFTPSELLLQLKTTFSTDSRVQNMFDILLSDETDKEKKEKVETRFAHSEIL